MKVGRVLKLAAPGYVDRHAEHLKNDLIGQLNVILAAADTFNDALASVQADTNLSPQGRSAAALRTARSALDTLAAVEGTTLKELADRATLVENAMISKVTYAPPKDSAERIAHELHLQEIRAQLRELPSSERLSVYLTSADPLVLAAIETAPMTLSAPRPDGSRRLEPFVDPEQRTAALMARAEAANPTAANTLRELRSVREVYALAVNSVRADILEEMPEAAAVPAA